jgi:hypothetical protein
MSSINQSSTKSMCTKSTNQLFTRSFKMLFMKKTRRL